MRGRPTPAGRASGWAAAAVLCGAVVLVVALRRPPVPAADPSPVPDEAAAPDATTGASPVAWAPGGMQVFILAGQSNMSGRGRVAELPPGFPRHSERILVLTNAGSWRPARAPIDAAEGDAHPVSIDEQAGVGPGLSFAEALLDRHPDIQVGLLPCAKGSTPIARWARSTDRETLYGSCVDRARLAADVGPIAGILWYQGEGDTHSDEEADAWGPAFLTLVEAWRSDLAYPELPVVFAQLATVGSERQRDRGLAAWDRLKQHQAELVHPGVEIVRTEDLPLDADGIHLTTAGQLELGRRFADAMDRLMAARYPVRSPEE